MHTKQVQQTTPYVPSKGTGEIVIESVYGHEQQELDVYSVPSVTSIKCTYPLKILVPKHAGCRTCKWIYPITFGGGLVGGDGIEMSVLVKKNCCSVLTGQESTKVYKCEDNLVSTMTTVGMVEPEAFLCVLSDPVVCYKDANFLQKQDFHLSCHGNLVYLDWVIGGRVALEELWQLKSYQTKTDVYMDGTLVYRDNYSLLNNPPISAYDSMKSFQVIGSCIILGRKLEDVSKCVMKKLGQKKSIGEPHDPELVCSVSPLKYNINEVTVKGVYIKFMSVSSPKAYAGVVSHIVRELEPIIGGDPFDDKYSKQ